MTIIVLKIRQQLKVYTTVPKSLYLKESRTTTLMKVIDTVSIIGMI